MNIFWFVLALISGYLLGSISFTRILGKKVAPGEDLSVTEVQMGQSQSKFQMHSVSATSLAFRKGPKIGCLVSLLDMLKAAVPVLGYRLAFPGADYYWLAAAGSVIGHNFPIYYRFKGGRGMSPLYGGLIIIDWLAIVVTNVVGMLLGVFVFRDMFATWTLSVPLLIPWMIYRHGSPIAILYSILVTVAFFVAIYPELKDHLANKRAGTDADASVGEFFTGASDLFMRKGRQENPDDDEILKEIDGA
ncbi:MAG: glycerol-3-phosphate acyltransferase [Anaerolineales bacterium]|jgi:glycerol-3-phosphate acyltransferase PlsY